MNKETPIYLVIFNDVISLTDKDRIEFIKANKNRIIHRKKEADIGFKCGCSMLHFFFKYNKLSLLFFLRRFL